MSLAGMVRRMGEAGATPEAIAIALEEIEAVQGALNARRSADRDRKREQRARQETANVTGQSEDNPGTVTPMSAPVRAASAPVSPHEETSSPLPNPQSPKGDSPQVPRRRRSPSRTADFEVPDWIPVDAWSAFAEMRRRKGKPLDSYTAKHLFGRLRTILEAGWNIEDVINKAAVGNHDGFWMPDGRDSNLRRLKSAMNGRDRPMNVDQLRNAIRFAEDHDDPERAAELKARLEAMREAPPADPKVANMVHAVSQKLQAVG